MQDKPLQRRRRRKWAPSRGGKRATGRWKLQEADTEAQVTPGCSGLHRWLVSEVEAEQNRSGCELFSGRLLLSSQANSRRTWRKQSRRTKFGGRGAKRGSEEEQQVVTKVEEEEEELKMETHQPQVAKQLQLKLQEQI